MKILARAIYLSVFTTLICTFPAQAAKVERVELYPFIEYFSWSEFDEGQRLLRETGPRVGFGAMTDININEQSLLLRLRGDVLVGLVDYDGHTMPFVLDANGKEDPSKENRPVKTDVMYVGTRIEGDLGWRSSFNMASLEPFAGLGYRFWARDIEDSNAIDTNGDPFKVTGYTEYWYDLYTKIGMRGNIELGSRATLTLEGGGKYSFITRNIADGTTLEPDGRWTAFAEAGVQVGRFRPALFYEGYRYNKSPLVLEPPYLVAQPESKADVFGINLYITIK